MTRIAETLTSSHSEHVHRARAGPNQSQGRAIPGEVGQQISDVTMVAPPFMLAAPLTLIPQHKFVLIHYWLAGHANFQLNCQNGERAWKVPMRQKPLLCWWAMGSLYCQLTPVACHHCFCPWTRGSQEWTTHPSQVGVNGQTLEWTRSQPMDNIIQSKNIAIHSWNTTIKIHGVNV